MADLLPHVLDDQMKIRTGLNLVVDAIDGMYNRGVISTAKGLANLGGRVLSKLPAEVHGQMAGLHDLSPACTPAKQTLIDIEVPADNLLNMVRTQGHARVGNQVAEILLRHV